MRQQLPGPESRLRQQDAAGDVEVSASIPVRLAVTVTDPSTARYLMRGQLSYLREAGFEVHLLTRGGDHLDSVAIQEGIETHPVPLEREIRPVHDLIALWGLVRALARIRPTVVCASTPKAGVLGMVAAALTRVPCRVYLVRGLRLETTRGWKRAVLRSAERLAASCAHRVVAVSHSLRESFVDNGLSPAAKVEVLGHGSSNGVDTDRYKPEPAGPLPPELEVASHLIGFVGRLVHDKGIEDLALAFRRIVMDRFPTARLVVLGDFEPGDPVSADARDFLEHDAHVLREGFVEDATSWYRRFDVVAFPSFREGLPNAPLEAAACGVPVVAYRATGTVDAVAHGLTGLVVEAGDWQALGEALCRYLGDPDLRRRHGGEARRRVVALFEQRQVWRQWREFYENLAGERMAS